MATNSTNLKHISVNVNEGESTNKTSNQSTHAGNSKSTTTTRDTLYRGVNPNSEPLPIPYKFNDVADSSIVTWLSKYDPSSLPTPLSDAFRLGPVQSSLGITKPIVWLANLSRQLTTLITFMAPHSEAVGASKAENEHTPVNFQSRSKIGLINCKICITISDGTIYCRWGTILPLRQLWLVQ